MPIGEYKDIYWYASSKKYYSLSDYECDYSKNVTLRAIFVREHYDSSSGDGGGSGIIPSIHQTIDQTFQSAAIIIQSNKIVKEVVTEDKSSWVYDLVYNTWKLEFSNSLGQMISDTNGFYEIVLNSTSIINGISYQTPIVDTYYFNVNGSMYTGWLTTADNNYYFFENQKTKDEGKMVKGWGNIGGYWYYFGLDGVMYKNTLTPDGHVVSMDGRWVQSQ